MKAVTIYAHGGNEQLRFEPDFPDPKIGTGDVLVRIRATSINYHDLFTRNGMPGIKHEFPWIMGMDFAGDIAAVGPGVEGEWKIGERVLVNPSSPVQDGSKKDHGHGGLAELFRARWHQLIRLPDQVDYAQAAALPVAYGSAHRMVTTIGKVGPGEKVLILGASGGVGVCALQLAKLAGAEVIAAGSTEEKGRRLLALGADHFINYATHNFMEMVFEKCGRPGRSRAMKGGGVDVVINFTGGETWVPSIRCLRHGGRLLTCGATAGFDPKEDIRQIWTFERQILGSSSWEPEDLHELLALVASDKLKVLIDRVFPLDQTAEALSVVERRDVFGKIIVAP